MANTIQQAGELGQSVWYDNMRRGMLESGELQGLIDAGITGLTSNPTIFEKAITGSTDYDDALLEQARQGKDAGAIYEHLVVDDIRAAADLLRPVYDRSDGADGFASLEVSPHLAHDTDGTVAEAKRLFATLDRPNVMMKVPGTPQGIPAVHRLIGEGVNVNVTLLFSLGVYGEVRQAYIAGLEDLDWAGREPGGVASVASFFVSRVDTSVDSAAGRQAAGRRGRRGAAGRGRHREREAGVPRLPRGLRRRAVRTAVREGRQGAAASLGQHEHEEPGLQRRAVRRLADRPGHGEYDARRHRGGVPRPRHARRDAGQGRRRVRALLRGVGGRGRRHGRGHRRAAGGRTAGLSPTPSTR